MMDADCVRKLLDHAAGKRLLVLGDVMVDEYVTGVVERISPEAPVPVVRVHRRECRPGGAANVALNVQALGGQAALVGAIGDDAAGAELSSLLVARGVDVSGLIRADGLNTTIKTRVVAERQQVVRVDSESDPAKVQNCLPSLCAAVSDLLDHVDGLVVEDYGKGLVCQAVLDAALEKARRLNRMIGFDPKDNHALRIEGITVATPNYREACQAAGLPEQTCLDGAAGTEHLNRVGRALMQRWQASHLVITLGPHGMYLMGEGDEPALVPTHAREVFDVSGAGDTVVAAVSLALVAGASYWQAARMANHAAGVVVGKLGTAVCTPAELLASVDGS